jgi:hypothetical protein
VNVAHLFEKLTSGIPAPPPPLDPPADDGYARERLGEAIADETAAKAAHAAAIQRVDDIRRQMRKPRLVSRSK